MENNITLTCSCGHVKLELYRDEEDYHNPDGTVVGQTVDYDLAFYYYRPFNSLISRIKTAWKYLIKGEKILLEDLILSQEEMNRLVEFVKK